MSLNEGREDRNAITRRSEIDQIVQWRPCIRNNDIYGTGQRHKTALIGIDPMQSNRIFSGRLAGNFHHDIFSPFKAFE